ncbi:MAG: 1-deoxy-D-xylulose-5-phosphate synthase [Victivallaceae bacterium]|nr:1-deoxy-D-xylulose-5-phosphate synthase [Victivallaceae bacterium]
MFLEKINSPADLRKLPADQLDGVCDEIRRCIIENVSKTGGHLASGLGCVELITALHYVFDVPTDSIVFDVGHQAYAHKILTGRFAAMKSLRKTDGISGFPSPAESPYDTGVSGHAGVAISFSAGLADARQRDGKPGKVIAVVGDGSLNCGISWEGLNLSSELKNLIVIINDNRMAISPNVGSLSRRLNQIISSPRYNTVKGCVRGFMDSIYHGKLHHIASKLDDLLKNALLPSGAIFQELDLRYIGPIDGHSVAELVEILGKISTMDGPIVVHMLTQKGRGYAPAIAAPDKYHGVPGFDITTGAIPESSKGFSEVFGEEIMELAERHPELEAVSASMIDGTGLACFRSSHPERCHDVGISEEHAVIFSAGLAASGKRPVCALYSTFAQRALDCIYHDVALANLPVIFALDRCGAVGDGPTHHGIYDLGFLREMPNFTIMCPRNGDELKLMLEFAVELGRPAVLRYPRGCADNNSPVMPLELGTAETLREGKDVAIWALGHMCDQALAAAELLHGDGIEAMVLNARFVTPFDRSTAMKLASMPMVTLEDHCTGGGLGAELDSTLSGVRHEPVLHLGWPRKIIPHGNIRELFETYGLSGAAAARNISQFLKREN